VTSVWPGSRRRTLSVLLVIAAAAIALSGCVARKYQPARKETAPPVLLNLAVAQPPIELALRSVIIYDGPGSWKREALWDEYVITAHNEGEQPLTIVAPALVDFAGASRAPGVDPWALEKESQTLEQRYRRAGVAFARSAVPRAMLMGASAASGAVGGVFSATAATAATASVVALPVYYVVVWSVNRSNKAAVLAEFNRRRLELPLTLAAGETRTGSLFFPMVPNPQSLNLQWSSRAAGGDVVFSLEPLRGLHAEMPAPGAEPHVP
jgi:hypothetical protein